MKKITLLLVVLLTSVIGSYGQCLDATSSTPLYPTATYTPAICDGTTVNTITTAAYASEYSNVNVILGETYTFTSSVATDFITIGSEDGLTAIVWGENGTLTWISDVTGVIRFYFHLDNACGAANVSRTRGIICGTPPTCPKPLNVAVSGITTTTADFTWDAGGSETEWEVLVLPNGDPAPDAATSGTPFSASTYTATSLNDSSAYQFYVRANCGGGDFSTWTAATNFATSCVAITDFTENFDAALAFPTCWSRVGTLGGANVQASATAPSAPNVLYLYGSSAAAQGMVAMPPLSNAGAGTHRLKFKARANFTVGGVIEVGYLTNIADAATFVSLQSFTTTSTTVFDTFIANLGTDPGANEVLAFRHLGVPAYSVLIDDVAWEPVPATLPSCASNFVATINELCGNFSTQITWDAATDADGYNLTIGSTAGGNDILDAQNIGGATSYSYSGTFNTTYYYKVVPFNFVGSAAGCTEESFTTFATGCYCTSLPTSNDGSGITNVQIGPIDFPTDDVTYVDHTATPVDLAQGISNNVQISFATGFTYGTNIWIDFNDNLTFDDAELVFSGTSLATNPTLFDASFVVPADATLGNHRMRIGTADSGQATPDPCFSGTYGVTLDFSVNIILPTCTPPSVVSSTIVDDCANNQYFVAVEVSGLGSGAPSITDGTTIYPVTAVGTIQIGPFVNGTSTSLTFLHGTETICDLPLGSFSYFCPPANDECSTATPMVITSDFASSAVQWYNTGATVNANDPLPTCAAFNFATAGKDVWFQSTAPESGSVIIETQGNGGITDTGFEVYTGDCGNLVLAACDDDTGTGNYSLYSFTGLTPGQALYIRLWGYNGQTGSALVGCYDASIASTNGFNSKNFTYYPNPVKDVLNLSYTNNISNVAVFNLLGQQMSSKTVNANKSKVDMSNLAPGTYLVKVTSDNQVKTLKVIKE